MVAEHYAKMQRKSNKNALETVQKESVIQAVIITDSYNQTFAPASETPCLMPLVNRPLLDYTLQCLSAARVQETIIFCTENTDQIKKFVKDKRWGRMVISVIVSDGCGSLGDAMRDLDAKGVIRGDFILLIGNIVGNLQLLPALEKHKKIQKSDKGAAMTLVYKECGTKTRNEEDQVFLAIDENTDRVLLHSRQMNQKKLDINVEILLEHSEVDMRYDLFDTKVSICSVTVPPLFSDNFDYQTRDDFVRGLLMNEEILASTIYSYVLPSNEYAACVTSWQNYHYISHDIIHRWTFPVVPDTYIEDCYSYKKNHTYLQENVTLAKNCHLMEDVVVGGGSILKENVKVSFSVIGKNCHISSNAVITNSHLFTEVNIEEGCNVEYCVLGEGSTLKAGVTLHSCILGPGVVIEAGKKLENMRIQSTPNDGEAESLGPKAFIYKPEECEDSDEDDDESGEVVQWRGLELDIKDKYESDDESIDSEDIESDDRKSPIPDDTNLFYSEVVDSLVRGFEDKVPCDNLVLEVNSSRYAYNVTVNEVNYYVVKAVLMLKEEFTWESVMSKMKYFLPLFQNYMKNGEAMGDCLNAIEDVAEMNPGFKESIMKLIHLLYNKDILSEDSILKWYNHPRSDGEAEKEIRAQVQAFVKWLEEAEMSDSDSED